MAYFDSPKNRAKWEVELDELKKKRSARDREGIPSASAARTQVKKESQVRWKMTFEELLEEEARAGKQRRTGETTMRKSKEKAPVKTEKGLER